MVFDNDGIMKKTFAAIFAAVSILAGGCAKKELTQPDAKLIDQANNYYSRDRFTQATESYRKSIEKNPDSPFRKAAILGLADSLYKDKSYFEAELYYERFVELYPMDPLKPRAAFYDGMCYYHDSHASDRDQTQTKKAMDIFNDFVKDYPDHPLAPYARTFAAEMRSTLAGSVLEIARFYHRVNKPHSAIGRLEEFLKTYQDTKDAPEAMYLLGDCYFREQSYKKAAIAFTDLIKKYPGSEYATMAAAQAESIKLKD